jgi:hypothetical protein
MSVFLLGSDEFQLNGTQLSEKYIQFISLKVLDQLDREMHEELLKFYKKSKISILARHSEY